MAYQALALTAVILTSLAVPMHVAIDSEPDPAPMEASPSMQETVALTKPKTFSMPYEANAMNDFILDIDVAEYELVSFRLQTAAHALSFTVALPEDCGTLEGEKGVILVPARSFETSCILDAGRYSVVVSTEAQASGLLVIEGALPAVA